MKEKKHGTIMRRNAFYVIGCFVLSALCVVGCNTAQIINIDPAKQIAQDESVKIRAEVEKRLKNNDIKGAEAFLLNEVLVGNSAADREFGRVRLLLLLDKVLDLQWAELKINLEKNYNRVKKCATVKEAQVGIAYFEKLPDNPIQVAKLPFWMQAANKEFSNKYEEKCNKINVAYNTLKDNYTAKLIEYLMFLEKRDFQLACNQLLEKVRATLIKNDYVSARKLLSETPNAITERFRPAMLAFRIGVLNTFVNPLQCQFVLADIDKKVKEFIANKKYEEGIKFLESYKIEGTENDLLIGLLKAVSAQYGYDYCCGREELEKFFAYHAEELQKLLDEREGAWVHPEEGKLEKAIQKLEGEMKKEIPNEIAVREFINNLRGYICNRNMTTAALKEILGNEKAANIIALSILNLEKAVKERVATKIAVLKLRASIQRPVGKIKTDGINFQDEIYNAEKQAKEKGIEKGFLLCEYARLMRILSEDTDAVDKVDKQVILAGAIALARPKVARWALDAGGDFSKPLPFVKSSALVLAFETSDAETIAWVLENNANINIAQDGIIAAKVATVMNRCDFIDIVFNAGFKPTKEQSKEMLNFACAKGCDVIFEKYISKGFEPTLDDFVSAVEAGCLPIVRFFVEKKFYDVNNVRIVNAVIANDQKVKESEKMVHNLVNFFTEKKFSDEESIKIVNAVIESEKKAKGKKVFEKTVHEVVKKYLVDRGMQLPSKQADDKYHKAAK